MNQHKKMTRDQLEHELEMRMKHQVDEQILPMDHSDMCACSRAYDKLPEHRRTKDADEAMFRAAQHLSQKQPSPSAECSILGFLTEAGK